jgi:hypothetical protein
VIVVAEAKRAKSAPGGGDHALGERVRAAVHAAIGVQVTHVEIVEVGTVPKTTSGKLKRRECKERFEAGTLGPPPRPKWHLLARVGAFNLLPARAQRWIDRARLFLEAKLDPRG